MNAQYLRSTLLLLSFLFSIISVAQTFNILMGQTQYWFWYEGDGLVGLGIILVSLPLLVLALLLRIISLKRLRPTDSVDFLCALLFTCLLFLPDEFINRELFAISLCLIALCWLIYKFYRTLRIMPGVR